MAKLVVLSAGLTGRSCDLNAEKTTIGRVEDNSFQIAEASVSSHHCEILLRGTDVVVKDLESTNGTFINGEKVSESVLKPGQTLRLGQVEMRLEVEGMTLPPPPAAGASAPSPVTPISSKRALDQTMVMRGVSLDELEQGPRAGFDTATRGFSKKSNKTNRLFLIGGVIAGVIILLVLIYAFIVAGSS